MEWHNIGIKMGKLPKSPLPWQHDSLPYDEHQELIYRV